MPRSAASNDTGRLLARLPACTAASVLAWLSSRGHDLPVHIPVATIKFARECFTLIDVDRSGTLEPGELQAVFTALGQPASPGQVMRLVESVAGPGARCLRFSDFAQMMHGAMSAKRREELELQSLAQQEVNLGGGKARFGRSQGRGGGRRRAEPGGRDSKGVEAEAEPELNWTDFHLLAKAFRRRAVIDGIISDTQGWRQKVAALAEKRAMVAHSAASVWRHRAQRLGQQQHDTSGCSTGATPRGACGPYVAIDDTSGAAEGEPSASLRSEASPAQGTQGTGAVGQSGEASLPRQRQLSQAVRQLLSRFQTHATSIRRSPSASDATNQHETRDGTNGAANGRGAARMRSLDGASWRPPAPPGIAALAASDARRAHASAAQAELASSGDRDAGQQCSAQEASPKPRSSAYDWQRSNTRMRLAAATSRQAAAPSPTTAGFGAVDLRPAVPPCTSGPAEAMPAGTPVTAPPQTACGASCLMTTTASSRARTADSCSASGTSNNVAGGEARRRLRKADCEQPAAAVERARLAAMALAHPGSQRR